MTSFLIGCVGGGSGDSSDNQEQQSSVATSQYQNTGQQFPGGELAYKVEDAEDSSTDDSVISTNSESSGESNNIPAFPVSGPGQISYNLRNDSTSTSPEITWDAIDHVSLSHYELAIGTTQGVEFPKISGHTY